MGLFDKKLSISALKSAVTDAAAKVGETVQKIDVADSVSSMKGALIAAGEKTAAATQVAYDATKERAVLGYATAAEELRSFDYKQLRDAEFYQQRYAHYSELSASKISEYVRSTFEVEKSTMQMVDDVRSRLPVPATVVDDIFEQCRREAIRRAVASFGLGGVVQDIDNRSAEKYNNLTESYQDYKAREAYGIKSDANFSAMDKQRADAIKGNTLATLENGYNKDAVLMAVDADIEHVIAKKEYYDDKLIQIANTDSEFNALINSPENLVFADGSLNRSIKDRNVLDYLQERGVPDSANPDIVNVTITSGGVERTVAVNKKDMEEAYRRADEKRNELRLAAAMEVGATVVKSGAAMAAQQVVGLIVLETIDIFIDEMRSFTLSGNVFNADGWLQNAADTTARIRQRLDARFEERQIWARARELGIEAGVAGALSVVPQILIAFVVKMPAFVLALIRESTLSVVRCVRVLASDDDNKLDSISVIAAGTASAIVGVYAGHVIGKAIAGVPLLNRFNNQVSAVLTGLFVTAVPLTAIYAFDQNKQKLQIVAAKFARSGA